MKKLRICVIGLGQFGQSIAKALAKHCEVLAIDSKQARVNAIAEDVQRALCIDARDFQAIASVVSADFDEAVVSIGEEMEASILCTLHLKRLGVPVIRAKANTQDHADILRSVGATEVIFPEVETAERRALQIVNPNLLDFIPIAEDYRVMDVSLPKSFHGHSLAAMQLRNRYGIFVIAVKKKNGASFVFLPGPNQVIEPTDTLVVIGKEKQILALRQASDLDEPPPRRPEASEPPGGQRDSRETDALAEAAEERADQEDTSG